MTIGSGHRSTNQKAGPRRSRDRHSARSRSFHLPEYFWPVAIAVLLTLILVFGGASRASVPGQVVARGASLLLIAGFIFAGSRDQYVRVRPLLLLLGSLAALVAIQLVPLPPDMWGSLPGREPFVAAMSKGAVAEGWRPISFTPDLTMNSLAALFVPIGAILGLGMLGPSRNRYILAGLLIVIAVSSFIGMMQVATGSPYFYGVTNKGSPVGLFANRNHQALFVASALPLLAAWALLPHRPHQKAVLRPWIALCGGVAVFPFLMVNGSRAGLLAGLAALAGAAAIVASGASAHSHRGSPRNRTWWWLSLAGGALALLPFFYYGRNEAFRRVLEGREVELRGELLPVFTQMVRDFFPFGSGFGSFDAIYRKYEPDWALSPRYLNHAHNDFIEVLFEGGLAAGLILIAFGAWYVRRLFKIWSGRANSTDALLARAGSILVALIALASLFDYPARTPIIALLLCVAAYWMLAPRDENEYRNRARAGAGADST